MGADAEQTIDIHFYIKVGSDGERTGACPFCQRVFMILLLKARANLLRFKVIRVNLAKPPPEFKTLGLNHLPAIIAGEDGFDTVDDIVSYLDKRFPGDGLAYTCQEADLMTKDFFSCFCFYIKSVCQDSLKLTVAIEKLNSYLERTFQNKKSKVLEGARTFLQEDGYTQTNIEREQQYLCGDRLTHLDCEVLPKLQHLRVAAKSIKNYDIPISFRGIWRYLHSAYSEPIFVETCPCDQEIIMHWNDRQGIKVPHKKHALLSKEKPKYSLDIQVHASVVTVIE